MIEYTGKYAKGKILIDNFESNVVTQLYSVLNNPIYKGCNIAVMPDCHIGRGSIVGFTSTIGKYISPSTIGVDIGCGVTAYKLEGIRKLKLDKLDRVIMDNIPYGKSINGSTSACDRFISTGNKSTYEEFLSRIGVTITEAENTLGSLGGGNHFISVEVGKHNIPWLVIHTGSRYLGFVTAHYHMEQAKDYINKVYSAPSKYGSLFFPTDYNDSQYIKDVALIESYARLNRHVIARKIVEGFYRVSLDKLYSINSAHNYIDKDSMIIRKGAINAGNSNNVIIPLSASYGSILGVGKSTKEYNYSAPHGAGHKMPRSESKGKISLDVYRKSMRGIYSSCINKSTIDESPQAYKNPKMILNNIPNLVDIEDTLKPVYNFKAGNHN